MRRRRRDSYRYAASTTRSMLSVLASVQLNSSWYFTFDIVGNLSETPTYDSSPTTDELASVGRCLYIDEARHNNRNIEQFTANFLPALSCMLPTVQKIDKYKKYLSLTEAPNVLRSYFECRVLCVYLELSKVSRNDVACMRVVPACWFNHTA